MLAMVDQGICVEDQGKPVNVDMVNVSLQEGTPPNTDNIECRSKRVESIECKEAG